MAAIDLEKVMDEQRRAFPAGGFDLSRRLEALKNIKEWIILNEEDIYQALKKDLHKGRMESYLTEVGIVLDEIDRMTRWLWLWSRRRRVISGLSLFPSRSYVYREAYGQVLIISPWNYPFQLAILPFIGAIAGGNALFLRPSRKSSETSKLLSRLIKDAVPADMAYFIPTSFPKDRLFDCRYDMIFFTGSPNTAKGIMAKAAENLTPVVLELGGKSPCYVTKNANLEISARRIAWGKLLNSGQTCIAPDYIIVDREVEEAFLGELKKSLEEMHARLLESGDHPAIINEEKFDRLVGLLEGKQVYCGGEFDRAKRIISPAIVRDLKEDDPLLQEEIFGPIFPVLAVDGEVQAMEYISSGENPLACYIFSEDKGQIKRLTEALPFGGGCVNDTMMHVANGRLPFGGVGASGMGSYHGRHSYETFSRKKAIVWSKTKIDLALRYPPHGQKKFDIIRRYL